MNKPLAILILAAGKGTRMKSARPKVMHEIAGRPLIGWLLETAQALQPERIIVVAGPGMPELEEAVRPHKVVIQKTRNGTGGALKIALPTLKGFKGDVLVLLGDAPLIGAKTLRRLVALRHKDKRTGLAVLGAALENPQGYGRLIADRSGLLEKIVEHGDANAREEQVRLVNTGAFCIDAARLPAWAAKIKARNAQKEYYITDLPGIAARDKALTRVLVAEDVFGTQGCNSRADLAKLEAMAQRRLRSAIMDSGVTLIDPDSVYFSYDTVVGADSVIEPHVFFGPGVSIGTRCRVKAFSHLEGVKTGSDVSIGPFARIRPGTVVGNDARIGNFVELKQSAIGAGSKISHLAYVGDCAMGEGVNFGAGAITVNFDGYEKHKTQIGSGAMVGSNVNLVAPVTIGAGAFVAAGSTVTGDVPEQALAVGRERTIIREGWAREFRQKKTNNRKKRPSV